MVRYRSLIGTPSPYSPHSPHSPHNTTFADPSFLGSQQPQYGLWRTLSVQDKIRKTFHAMNFLVDKYRNKGGRYSTFALHYDAGLDEFDTFNMSNRVYVNQQLAVDEWIRMMRDRKCKIMFIYCSVHDINGGHANWVIVDKVRKIVEFFDPNGAFDVHNELIDRFEQIYCCKDYQTNLCFIPDTYRLISYADTCPNFGFQSVEYFSGGPRTPNDLEGYCMFWAMFMLDMRLANLHLKTKHIQELYLERVMNETGGLDEMGQAFRKFIRQYVQYWAENIV